MKDKNKKEVANIKKKLGRDSIIKKCLDLGNLSLLKYFVKLSKVNLHNNLIPYILSEFEKLGWYKNIDTYIYILDKLNCKLDNTQMDSVYSDRVLYNDNAHLLFKTLKKNNEIVFPEDKIEYILKEGKSELIGLLFENNQLTDDHFEYLIKENCYKLSDLYKKNIKLQNKLNDYLTAKKFNTHIHAGNFMLYKLWCDKMNMQITPYTTELIVNSHLFRLGYSKKHLYDMIKKCGCVTKYIHDIYCRLYKKKLRFKIIDNYEPTNEEKNDELVINPNVDEVVNRIFNEQNNYGLEPDDDLRELVNGQNIHDIEEENNLEKANDDIENETENETADDTDDTVGESDSEIEIDNDEIEDKRVVIKKN